MSIQAIVYLITVICLERLRFSLKKNQPNIPPQNPQQRQPSANQGEGSEQLLQP